MKSIRITAVSYLNTFPFVYGLLQGPYASRFHLDLAIPSLCAAKLKSGDTDIALIPTGALPDYPNVHLVSDYCIGSKKTVRTVLLLSRIPLSQIQSIGLDFESRTSVNLVKILAAEYWNIQPEYYPVQQSDIPKLTEIPSLVAIGDKTFELSRHYPYRYDLAGEWFKFTGLPFVFAVWASLSTMEEDVIRDLNECLRYGLSKKAESLEFFSREIPNCDNCLQYLEENISYLLDGDKRKGMELFLKKLNLTFSKTLYYLLTG